MSLYEFKRGDTFDLAGDASLLIDGEPASFVDVTIDSWVRPDNGQGQPTGDEFATLVGAWLDIDLGLYHVSLSKESTAAWPIGRAVLDVAFTWPDGRRLTTPSLVFLIVGRSTYD